MLAPMSKDEDGKPPAVARTSIGTRRTPGCCPPSTPLNQARQKTPPPDDLTEDKVPSIPLKDRLVLVAVNQPAIVRALPYMKLLCLLADDGQTTPASTHTTAMQYLHDSLRNTNKDPSHKPFQFCLLWYDGTFHIGHSLCLSTLDCPTLNPDLLLTALGEPNELGQHT